MYARQREKQNKRRLHVAKMEILGWMYGATRNDKITYENTSGSINTSCDREIKKL